MKHSCTIAITGHRDVIVTEVLKEEIKTFFQNIYETYSDVTLLSALAEGADMLVADIFLAQNSVVREHELQVPLPFTQETYIEDYSSVAKAQFVLLASQATRVFEVPKIETDPYVNLGRYLVEHSDILLALWDGKVNHKVGGTADVVAYAKSENHPVFHINCQRHNS